SEFGARRKCHAIEDRHVNQLHCGQHAFAAKTGAYFISKSQPRVVQIESALRSKSVKRTERHLRVKEFLARTLKRKQLLGLRLKRFDAAFAGGRHGLQDSNDDVLDIHLAQSKRKPNDPFCGGRRHGREMRFLRKSLTAKFL